MYISVWRTVCLLVNLAILGLGIFLDRKPVTIDYRHFIYTSSIGEWVGRKLLHISGPHQVAYVFVFLGSIIYHL
jgi:hypothetical protein